MSKAYTKYKRTKKGLCGVLYSRQVSHSRKRGHNPPEYSLKEFRYWLIKLPKFDLLFKKWELSGYSTDFVPSVDRIDSHKGYSFDNIQLMTWGENNEKGKTEKRTVGKMGIEVICTDIKTGKETTYQSQREASRDTGVNVSGISQCLNGKQKKTRGYLWRYKTLKT